jgi:hypothetical protein
MTEEAIVELVMIGLALRFGLAPNACILIDSRQVDVDPDPELGLR